MTATVLVTGATGFVAKHCIAELLRRGHRVRATLRDHARAAGVRQALTHAGVDGTGIDFRVADLTRDEGWDAALDGCSYVMHVASPFPLKPPRHRDDIVKPAREGTLRVLAAATRAKVQRVVLTSSMVACIYPASGTQARTYTEADWTDPARFDISDYIVSKTLAERAAWDLARTTPGAPELAVLNPGFVHGPALDTELSVCHHVLRRLAKGLDLVIPNAGYAIVDVRDLAVAHAVAMQHPAASGERFLVADGYLTMREMGQVLAGALPDLARRVPRIVAPDFMIRAVSLFDTSLRTLGPELSTPRLCNSGKARGLLGLTFRPARAAVRDAALSLRQLGVI